MNDYDKSARHAIQAYLNGESPNGSEPRDFGEWAETVAAIGEASDRDGVRGVRKVFNALAGQWPALAVLIAGDPETTPAPEVKLSIGDMPPLPIYAQVPEGLGADASPWLDRYIQFSRLWSPRAYEGFHEGCGIFILSTCAGRRVALHLGGRRFGNLYILLTARTSLHAKSTTAKIALQTLESADLDWMLAPDEATPQAFIRHLTARLPDNFDDLSLEQQDRIKNRLAIQGARGWYYEEFGQKLAAMTREGSVMADFRGLLRSMDENPKDYEYVTIHRGSEVVEAPYLALLANVTPADMKPLARRGASMWNDGFWARFAFICPPTIERRRERWPAGERLIPKELIDPLREWHWRLPLPPVRINTEASEGDASGPTIEIDPTSPATCTLGEGVFEAFYNYHDGLLDIVEQYANTDLDGNYCRFGEKAMRVAILLASLENDNRIELKHWARAQAIAERWRAGLHALYNELTEPEPTEKEMQEEKILKFVSELGNPTAREVAQRIRGIDTAGAALMLDQLTNAGIVAKKKSAKSNRYCLPKEK